MKQIFPKGLPKEEASGKAALPYVAGHVTADRVSRYHLARCQS